MKMDKRQQELSKIKDFIENIGKETTLLLQNLQWDHKHLIGSTAMVSCKYVAHHRIPVNTTEAHENQCYLTQHGYKKDHHLLPDPINPDANTVVKLNRQDIMQIINTASTSNSISKSACAEPEPLSLDRLQQVYSTDERRAIHKAVVNAAPFCHDLADLALGRSSARGQQTDEERRAEILAELRDMKRRRTKYRVASKSSNYSDVLRGVIRTQMDLYAEARGVFIKTEYGSKTYVTLNMPKERTDNHGIVFNPVRVSPSPDNDNNREASRIHLTIKQERISPDGGNYSEDNRRYRERSRSRDNRKSHYSREREPRRKRDHYHDKGYSSEKKTRKKESSQEKDKYASKERRRYDESQSKRDTYVRIKGEASTSKDRHGDWRMSTTQEFSTSNDNRRYRDDRKKLDRKHSDDFSKNKNKHNDSRENEKRHRSYKDSSKQSKYDYFSKHNEYLQK